MTGKKINTEGGTFVGKDVNTDSGDFVGRDQTNTINNSANTTTTSNTYLNGNLIIAITAILVVGIIGTIAILRDKLTGLPDSLTSAMASPTQPVLLKSEISPEAALRDYFGLIENALDASSNNKTDFYNIAFKFLSNNFVKATISEDKDLQHLPSDFEKYQWGWENVLGRPTILSPGPVTEFTKSGDAVITLELFFSRLNSSYKVRYVLRQDKRMGIERFGYWLIVDSKFIDK